jgi:putative endonuclease
MSSGYKKLFGQRGEDEAVRYLIHNGFKIIERNFRIRNGEIDIIALDESVKPKELVFVEVKTRLSDLYGDPLEAINYYKMQALKRTALFYQIKNPKLPQLLRLDAIAVVFNHDGTLISVKLVKNIS